MSGFESLSLPPQLLQNLNDLGFTEMTEVQSAALPEALKGRDLIVQAQTGSGKTLAFGIPLLLKIDTKSRKPQAIVIAPTRELADQIAEVLRKLARYRANIKILTLCGGMPMRRQMSSLEAGAHIVVGTPGRLLDHLGKGTLHLEEVNTAVLDEADRMLDMGFIDEVAKILSRTPQSRQTLLFSATFAPKIEALAKQMMHMPQKVTVTSSKVAPEIEEHFFSVRAHEKEEALLRVLHHFAPASAIVFATTREQVRELTHFLQRNGFVALDLQGDLDQSERTETLLQFANGSVTVLVATDLAARGLDIDDVALVVNYEMPHEREHYLHRIGRTGRAGKKGVAVSLVERVDAEDISTLSRKQRATGKAAMRTLKIMGGKRDKLRPGDIVGALIHDVGIENAGIGKIMVQESVTYVAIRRALFSKALEGLQRVKIKGKKFKAFSL